ncbi:MAG TPA: hypothetical protein PKA64_21160, partial [Myxococcota bacterium]|nr:hypothetical protein [Myxococcota bacterium]
DRPRTGPALLAASTFMAWIGVADTYSEVTAIRNPWGLTRVIDLQWLVGPEAVIAVSILLLACGVQFARKGGSTLAAGTIFLVLFLYAHIEEALDAGVENVMHGKFLPGGAMIAWYAGVTWGRTRDPDGGVRRGLEMAADVAASLYLWAGLIKIKVSGVDWVHNVNLPLLVLERAYMAGQIKGPLRAWFSGQETLLSVFSGVVVVIESAGLLMLWPRWRISFAAAASIMHLCIGTLMGYYYVEWSVALWGIAIWSRYLYLVEPAIVTSPSHERPPPA